MQASSVPRQGHFCTQDSSFCQGLALFLACNIAPFENHIPIDTEIAITMANSIANNGKRDEIFRLSHLLQDRQGFPAEAGIMTLGESPAINWISTLRGAST
ncbi:hypothetical protein H0G86_010527 [Trichoderma simmonsii]|uniref:Uncharacterized protein n=1 Tax=Trichoderma simmonsii TaxID=1491479 RepID=A0A8G0PP24_9HYPO|nr:hypothetical protein H0G86_010527 [Trichoderma simmonsii]